MLLGDSLNFICVDFTVDPVELLVCGPLCCGEKMTDVCGKQDVVMFAVDVTNEGVVTCSVTCTLTLVDAILKQVKAFESTKYFRSSYNKRHVTH